MRRLLAKRFTGDFQDYEVDQSITNRLCLLFMENPLLSWLYLSLLNQIVRTMFPVKGYYTAYKKDGGYIILGINMPDVLLHCQPDRFFPQFKTLE